MSNAYKDFIGASSVDSFMLFPQGKNQSIDVTKPENKKRYDGVLRYLPGKDYLIGRVAMKQQNSNKEFLKIFVSGAWDGKARQELELAKFTLVDPKGLVSDKIPDLGSDGWKAVKPIEIRNDVHPQGHLSAKITFDYKNPKDPKAKVEETVDAFWCWPW